MLTEDLIFKIANIAELGEFAELFANCLSSKDLVCLTGDLGAGKTTFTRALVKALGFSDFVSSPTFNILHEYSNRQLASTASADIDIVYHFDTYRLETEENFQASALDDYFGEGLCLIEWGELIAGLLPEDAIYLAISYKQDLQDNSANTARRISLTVPKEFTQRKKANWQKLFNFCKQHVDAAIKN